MTNTTFKPKHHFCIKCEYSLRKIYNDFDQNYMYCDNDKCERYGLLTIVFIVEDQEEKEVQK